MHIGVPHEIKIQEYRVGLIPASVRELTHQGHTVTVETDAGAGVNFSDDDYRTAGASIAPDAAAVFATAETIVKVKEPQATEFSLLREGQVLFTYLHLAAESEVTDALVASNCIAIGYETVTGPYDGLPLLSPMSEVAGRMSIQAGAHCLELNQGGRGTLLGGVPGVLPGKVVVIGGGVVGTNAARMAMGLEANVTVVDRSVRRLQELDALYGDRLDTVYSTVEAIHSLIRDADVVVGGVLVAGAEAPKLVTRAMLGDMQRGAVIVDVAIDQGGCTETSKATTHDDPTYVVDDIVHYCVANMPGAVARTSTFALNNATLPFTVALADKGYKQASLDDPHLLAGLNVHEGKITYEAVAKDLGYDYYETAALLG